LDTSTTSGASGNTAGFGITSAGLNIFHLVVNNRAETYPARMARITGTTRIRKLTINTGGYLFTSSGTTANTTVISDTLINNGTLAGCEPSEVTSNWNDSNW